MARTPVLRAPVVAQGAGAAGGLLLLAATFVPWSRRGAGSSIALRRVADLVLSGTVDAWVPRGAGLVVYAIPLGGALLVLGAGLGGRTGLAAGAAGLLAAAAGTALTLGALSRLDGFGPDAGALLATVGLALGLAAVAAGGWAIRRPPTPEPPAPPPHG